jgi:hypothetical protein
VQDSVEVPEFPRVTLVGARVQVNPVDGDTDATRLTDPVNPLIAVTVIVEVPEVPALTGALVGLAVTEKSGTATV